MYDDFGHITRKYEPAQGITLDKITVFVQIHIYSSFSRPDALRNRVTREDVRSITEVIKKLL